MNIHALFAAAPVARLATTGERGTPHVVPITFVCDGDLIHTPIDHKPKKTTRLRRLINIEHNARVSVLVDHYEDDWTALWWVRTDGEASVIGPGSPGHAAAAGALAAKYPPYRAHPPAGPIIEIGIDHWASWAASGSGPATASG